MPSLRAGLAEAGLGHRLAAANAGAPRAQTGLGCAAATMGSRGRLVGSYSSGSGRSVGLGLQHAAAHIGGVFPQPGHAPKLLEDIPSVVIQSELTRTQRG